jgi:hypothetical protein
MGALKHRRVGFLRVYAIDLDKYKDHLADIDELNKEEKKKISISSNYGHNEEILVHLSIPKEFIIGYKIFSLPKFNKEWSNDIQENYGLNKVQYKYFKTELLANPENSKKNLIKIMQSIIKFQAITLEKKVKSYYDNKVQDELRANLEEKAIISNPKN